MSNTVTVNGRTIVIPNGASSISVRNGVVYVNGSVFNEDAKGVATIELKIEGEPLNVTSDCSIDVKGNVLGNADSGGSLNCRNIGGNARSGGSMNCGNVGGDARSNGSMNRN